MKIKGHTMVKDGTKTDYNKSFKLLSFLFKFTEIDVGYGLVFE